MRDTLRNPSMDAAAEDREGVIVRTSALGIAANLLLAGTKLTVGLLSNSIAVVLDAVNNLSDALSSVITILGTKLAGRAPDRNHPLGHGRYEYLTALVVAGLVLYAGITAMTESVRKILNPETPEYSAVTLILLAAAVLVKLALSRYVRRIGEQVHSASLIASGVDAASDVLLSSSVLASALLFRFLSISLEAYVGAVIAGFIIKSGVDMMRETLDDILGHRTDKELADAIKATICEDPDVHGAFDLYIFNYGPDRDYGSVHVEVNDTMTADEIDALDRRLQSAVYRRHGVILTGIGLYSINTRDDEAGRMRRAILEAVMAHQYALQLHGFYVDFAEKRVTFDVVLDFACDRAAAIQEIHQEIQALYPEFTICAQPDIDIAG